MPKKTAVEIFTTPPNPKQNKKGLYEAVDHARDV